MAMVFPTPVKNIITIAKNSVMDLIWSPFFVHVNGSLDVRGAIPKTKISSMAADGDNYLHLPLFLSVHGCRQVNVNIQTMRTSPRSV
jgi:hypothetical protein